MIQPKTLGRFDRLVWLTVAAVLAIIGLVMARGDQLQLQALLLSPAPQSTEISTRATLRLQFDQPVSRLSKAQLTFSPPITGATQLNGDLLTFAPTRPFQPHTTYTVTLAPTLRGQQGGELREPIQWRFTTGGVRVLYSTVDEQGKEQLYVVDAGLDQEQTAGPPTPLTTGALSIWDFAVQPTNSSVTYAALKEDGTSDLLQIAPGDAAPTVLVPCPNAVCSGMSWSADGRLLAYSRRNATQFGAATLSPPRLWLFDPATSETLSFFNDGQKLAFDPRWSADNQWLTYLSPDPAGLGVVNVNGGEERFYTSDSGEAGVWQPTANRFVYSKVQQLGDLYVTHLVLVDPVAQSAVNLSGETADVEDGGPAWSPDGAWLAFRRKEFTGPGATPGKQIWLMRADGSEQRALTADPEADHSAPQWSPDGRYLLYHKLPLKGPNIIISVWIMELETGNSWLVAEPGQRPVWLP